MKIKAIVLTLALIFAGVLFRARQLRTTARTHIYGDAISYLESSTQPGETIGYLSSHESYLLYGQNFDRKVVYLPFKPKQPLSTWLKTIRDRRITTIAAGRLIDDSGVSKAEIYQRLSQAEKQGKLIRVFGQGQDPRQQLIIYRLEQQ